MRTFTPALCLLLASASTQSQATPLGGSPFTRAIGGAACQTDRAPRLAPRRFSFPRDDGAHDGFADEWWRTFGRVTDDVGTRFDFSVNISRFGIDTSASTVPASASRWFARHLVTVSYELLDERTLEVARGTFVDREGALGATIARNALSIVSKGITYAATSRTRGGDRRYGLEVHDASDANALSLDQRPSTAALPLGPRGVMRTGSCISNAAYAYAYPRNVTRGVLRFGGVEHHVSGLTWIEHEFAHHELSALDAGWSRFEVQFDDGRAVDARFTRDASGDIVATSGVFVAANGAVTYLKPGMAGAGLFPPGSTWHSDATNIAYPATWILGVKPGHLGLATVEIAHDQEIREPGRTPYYWGAIVVEKAEPPGGDPGHGFVELTGYGARASL